MEENNIIRHLEKENDIVVKHIELCEKDIHMIKLDMQLMKDNIVLIKELLNNYLLYNEKKILKRRKDGFFR